MLTRTYAQCTVCHAKFIVRAGIGLEKICNHTFDCPTCFTPITAIAKTGSPPIAWIEMSENAQVIPEDSTITECVNLHPAIAFRPDEFKSPIAFASPMYLEMIHPYLRAPSDARMRDAATEFEIPDTSDVWKTIRNIITLEMKGDAAGILQTQVQQYSAKRKVYSPHFTCTTSFKSIASFFDDIFYPAFGNLRHPLKKIVGALKVNYSSELEKFSEFYRAELEQANIERYLSTFNDYFRHYDQYRQMLAHARVSDDSVDDLVVGSKNFDEIRLYYGQAYETLTSSYVTLACLNNISQGRSYDQFATMTLSKYIKDVDKSKRSNPFNSNPELHAFTAFEDGTLRNGSHHASFWRDGNLVKFKSGGTGAERNMSLSRYLHFCNGITISTAALFVLELEFFSSIRL